MARIATGNDTTVFKLKKFLGLNENPDGDTVLKQGELAEMRNFRITHDNHLQIRPGTKTVVSLADALSDLGDTDIPANGETHARGFWRGIVGGKERTLAVFGGHVWEIDLESGRATERGGAADEDATFFGFDGKVYLVNGREYLCWDGEEDTAFADVEGYVPLVQIATTPEGSGTQLEPLNRLTNKRRVQFSPDGSAKRFQLPEKNLDTVLEVTLNGEVVTGYNTSLNLGQVIMPSGIVPEAGVNTLEVTYAKGEDARSEVTGMRYCELFNGSTDTRVFLYGDGSNRAIYSGIPYQTGQASADYFPALFEVAVGDSNTPITALVRHYSRLMAYKAGSAWVIQYGTVTLDDGTLTPAFYVQPVNRQLGNEAPGQVRLVENSPLTVDEGNVYQWRSSNAYSSYISSNENNAKRVSDRVTETLATFDLKKVKTFNINADHEYWFLGGDGRALILNYANDTWYFYDRLSFCYLLAADREKYGLCDDGRVVHVSRTHRNDDGQAIDCYAATGAMDFERSWLLKYSPMLFVAIQPEVGARITVSVESNRRTNYPEKVVSCDVASFTHMNFGRFSFLMNRRPQVARVKMKVKKATFYRLAFTSNSASATATVIEADVKLRYAGTVK